MNVSQSVFSASYPGYHYSGHHRYGLPKLLKVLDWLVMEKDDPDRSKMTEERVSKFVDFVFSHQDLCEIKQDGKIKCEKLRQEIDKNKLEAGSQGIDFNDKMKSLRKKMKGHFSSYDINNVQPYGVLLILEWALEFGNEKHTAVSELFPRPSDLKALVKFIINHKDDLWALIDRELRSLIVTTHDLKNYFMDNLDEMGWRERKPLSEEISGALLHLRYLVYENYDKLMAKKGISYTASPPTSVRNDPTSRDWITK
ncbi:uncharacterized protein LOC141850607 isoform X2 [Brevipalpus obovatus]|uniref:uncharacterized protein LOC141850607 isoform X2 n=1 Tax=Brevipalpus obovatus TaxID=246614 RepID=UPI003D9EFA4E